MKPGKRIVILGVSASGKSTLARALAQKLSIPLVHMDSIMWNPGWIYTDNQQALDRIKSVVSTPEWIIEGYIPKDARMFVFDMADTIIYLDYPSRISAWRYIRRWLIHRNSPRPELAGCPDKFSFSFLQRIWSKAEIRNLLPHLAKPSNQEKTITLTHPKSASGFLREL